MLEKLSGKTIILGTLDLSGNIETPETVSAHIRSALPYVPAERIVAAPYCGLKYLQRAVAFGKMAALVAGARREIARAQVSTMAEARYISEKGKSRAMPNVVNCRWLAAPH